MDGKDKKVETAKTSTVEVRGRGLLWRILAVFAVIAVIVLAVIVLIPVIQKQAKTSRSNNLIKQVKSVSDGTHDCSYGLNKLKSASSKLGDDKTYNNAAREKALNFLMVCSFENRNSSQALKFADELRNTYTAEGHNKYSRQQRDLNTFITFMKSGS